MDSLNSSGIESSEDEDQVTKNKNLAMDEVFRIPSMVQQIIQEVSNQSDLKQCRLVNSTWMETTTKVIFKRNSAYVALKWDYRRLQYKKVIQFHTAHLDCYLVTEQDVDHLATLNEIVDKSTQFPCSKFIIDQGELSVPNMENFFKVVGQSIKNLKLIFLRLKPVKIVELLGVNCPNLETLYLYDCVMDWSDLEEISFELPKLKMLRIQDFYPDGRGGKSHFKILETLIAPNLQVIRGFRLPRDMDAVITAGKTQCIKKLEFLEIGNPDNLIQFEMFVQVCPQLETLKLSFWESFNNLDYDAKTKWMRLIKKLLDLSKTTLISFSFEVTQDVLGNLNFPRFSQLQEIQIEPWRTAEQTADVICPYEILSDDIFPNVKIINGFDLSRDTQQVVRAEKIHCIKQIHFYLKGQKLEYLGLFLSGRPQLQILVLGQAYSGETMNLDWKMELSDHLEQLLELSKDTLKSFQFIGVGAISVDMKFPKFSKLRYLNIKPEPVRIFPKGINLTETFPALEILAFHGCNLFDNDAKWDSYFPPPDAFMGSLTSVRTLIVQKEFTANGNLQMMCPNAKEYNIFEGSYC